MERPEKYGRCGDVGGQRDVRNVAAVAVLLLDGGFARCAALELYKNIAPSYKLSMYTAGNTMTKNLEELVERTRKITMSAEQIRAQRQSFAYGNTKIENERITREMVVEIDRRLESEQK
jgi:hypothetical protein